MKNEFNKITISIIISSIMACIIGLVMLFIPDISIKTIGVIACIYLIVHGIILITIDIKISKYYIPFDGLLTGITSVILGLLLLVKPEILPTIFTIVIGIWFVLSSVNIIKMALTLKKYNIPWIQLLLLGIFDLLAGIVVLLDPFTASMSMVMFIGIMIIIHSISNIVDMVIVRSNVKSFENAIKSRFKIDN